MRELGGETQRKYACPPNDEIFVCPFHLHASQNEGKVVHRLRQWRWAVEMRNSLVSRVQFTSRRVAKKPVFDAAQMRQDAATDKQ